MSRASERVVGLRRFFVDLTKVFDIVIVENLENCN